MGQRRTDPRRRPAGAGRRRQAAPLPAESGRMGDGAEARRSRTCSPRATPRRQMAGALVAGDTRSCSSGSCGWPCCGPRPSSASTCPAGAIEAYQAVVDQGVDAVDLGLDRRARAGHPARRQGAHRGVRRAGRPRADPQGHDQPRPHRERRAAAGARPRWRWSGQGAGRARPAGPPRRRVRRARRWPAARTTSPRRRPRWASGSPPPPTNCSSRSGRLDDLIARYPLRGIKGPVGTAQDMLDLLGGDAAELAELERRVAEHLGFAHVLTSVGQVYPRSLDYDVLTALVQVAAAPSSLATTIRLMAGQRARHRGVPARPGRLVRDAAQDEHPLGRADQRLRRHAARLRVDGRRARRRPVERGRRVVLGGAPGRAAGRVLRRWTGCSRRR